MSREIRLPILDEKALASLPTPCYLTDEAALRENVSLLNELRHETDCKILLAQKAFSAFRSYPLLAEGLDGTTASGLHEARLGHEEMPGKEVHVFSPGYTDAEMAELVTFAHHLVFNSWSQWLRHRDRVQAAGRHVSCGLRINPEVSTQETAMYDPCSPGSRLGITREEFERGLARGWFEGIEGLHFHTLCEQDSDALLRTWEVVKEKFGAELRRLKWLNMGGGHHITRPGYHLEILRQVIREAQDLGLTVYLEPGEAVALNAGFLCAKVVDVVHNALDIAILDTSATCHMPDVLEMPYRPRIFPIYDEAVETAVPEWFAGLPTSVGLEDPDELGSKRIWRLREDARKLPLGTHAKEADAKGFLYRLSGPTCLAGDVIGDYVFPAPLLPGDTLVFCDMAIYTMVKSNTFNGMPLPALLYAREDGSVETWRTFGYEDFKSRL